MLLRRETGFTLIELLVVIAIIGTLAGMVTLLIGPARNKSIEIECMSNVRGITGLLDAVEGRYPRESGPAFILYLVRKKRIQGEDQLEGLFCPGDQLESLEDAGGAAAYEGLDLSKNDLGSLTSYAGRDQKELKHRAARGGPAQVLVVDDSDDHHGGRGFVVGLTGSMVKFRDKVDDYELDAETTVVVGPQSQVEELRALLAE